MKAHLAYFKYVVRHKWFVFVECCKAGIPLLGLVHDWHKFLPSEWGPYVHFFHNQDGTKKQRRDKAGYYKPTDTGDSAFDSAWFLHQKRAFHHWQSWVYPKSQNDMTAVPMPARHRLEMLADWRGAGRAQGTSDTKTWYEKNGSEMMLHPETRQWIEEQLGVN